MSNIIVSKQDANQVLRLAYDDATKSLRTTGSALAEQTVVQPDGTKLHVTVDASVLPTGAATEAKQDDAITELQNVVTNQADQTASLTNIQTTSGETATNTLVTANTLNSFSAKTASGMVTVPFDEQTIAYVGATSDIDSVTYKNGGVTVATVTLSYDGQNRLTGVVRS